MDDRDGTGGLRKGSIMRESAVITKDREAKGAGVRGWLNLSGFCRRQLFVLFALIPLKTPLDGLLI